MKSNKLIPIILSGGSGNRLWPRSREAFPKQLLNLSGDHSLLQNTVLRVADLPNALSSIVVSNAKYRFLVAEQLNQIQQNDTHILLEPVGRNTAPALAIAAMQVVESHGDGVMLALPADHLIEDRAAFHAAVSVAMQHAEQNKLVTFGIAPTKPETGYGYIQAGDALQDGAFVVQNFVEKPDQTLAEQYVAAGNYFWNSGMFVMKASVYLSALKQYAPDILAACQTAFDKKQSDLHFTVLDAAAFATCPKDSIDYAVMEKTHDAVVVPFKAAWSDVGSWSALQDIGQKDANQNVLHGDVVTEGVCGSYIYAQDRLVAAVGLQDHVVVETKDAVLVAHKDACQDVKKITQQLQAANRLEAVVHQQVYRPWGYYESLSSGPGFQVKRIVVNPGARLSLQLHHQRSEHWVVVSGVASIECGDERFELTANQSTYIPVGVKHRLSNETDVPLAVVEVQSGAYLGEDDIVRFEDQYART